MRELTFAVMVFCGLGTAALAADHLPRDVQAYVDRRAGCNYWPSEPAYDKVRKAEIERNVRNLRCSTLNHEEVVLQVRYRDKPDILTAIAEAHDAMPD
jgi:hypothetical protein